jgi:Ser/Thr protein kinase RdoA (MazF antagonist)
MLSLNQASSLDVNDAVTIAREVFSIVVVAKQLPSERDQNFLLTTESGEKFVLKIANSGEQRSLIEAQNEAMAHLSSSLSFCPRVVTAPSGEAITQILTHAAPHYVRLVTYIPGEPLANGNQTRELLIDVGKRLGQFSGALTDFDHAAFHRDFHWDLAKGLKIISEFQGLVRDEGLRSQLAKSSSVFEDSLASVLPRLPCKVIHGDANDYNVLVEGQKLVGLIDFGDMIYSYTVGDLAIAIAYVVLDKSDPLECAKAVAAGYVSEHPLNEDEIAALWPLILMRLCMSVCLAAYQQQQKPENKYLEVSQRSIRNSLPRLLGIDTRLATNAFWQLSGCTR